MRDLTKQDCHSIGGGFEPTIIYGYSMGLSVLFVVGVGALWGYLSYDESE